MPTRKKLVRAVPWSNATLVRRFGSAGAALEALPHVARAGGRRKPLRIPGETEILREIESRTGVPGGFIESDLVDPRYFSAANIKNRLESYFQMIEQKRLGRSA